MKAESLSLTSFANRSFVFLFSAIFLLAAGYDAYWQEMNYSFFALAALAAFLLMQYPEYLLYSLLILIPWSVEYHLDGSLSTDLPDEPIMLLGAGAALIYCIYNRRFVRWRRFHPLLVILCFQFLWTIITVVTSTDFILSLKYLLAKTWYLLAFVALPLSLFKNEKVLKRSAVLLLTSMTVVMAVSLTRHAEYYWSFEKVNEALRPFFQNHVLYSALLVFMVPLAFAIIRLGSRRIKLFLICLLVIIMIALYFSYARGAWAAFFTGILAYWLLQKRLLLTGFLLFSGLTIAAVFWLKSSNRFLQYSNDYKTTIFHSNFKEHLIATYKLKDLSNAERFYRWVAGVRMVPDYWETGTGPTTFYNEYKSYTLPAFKTYVSDNKEHSTVHNYFLLVLIEQGIMGLLLLFFLLGSIFWYCQKLYQRTSVRFWKVVIATIASIMVMECTVNFLSDMIETDKVGSIFYICLATLIVADFKTKGSDLSTNVQSIS